MDGHLGYKRNNVDQYSMISVCETFEQFGKAISDHPSASICGD
jgi:hypothetical protein